jgi:putative spermidine/putrescine transport system ATP-binding protein
MSDRVAVMRDGRVLQVASPKELYERPPGASWRTSSGPTTSSPARAASSRARQSSRPPSVIGQRDADAAHVAGERCVLAVRPENIALGDAPREHVRGRSLAAYLGSTLRYDVEVRAASCSRWTSATPGTTRCCRWARGAGHVPGVGRADLADE